MSDKKEIQPPQKLTAMMQVVRNTIFKNATNEELALFFHICKSNNVSPLDRLLFPSVYNDAAGNRTVVVVTSIDLMRSRSVDTQLDDGMDEPEYSTETISFQDANKTEFIVPEWCKVRVYKKGVDRPYIGVARWKEFYPGEKRGHMWRKMPMVMLAKCAEAQARRLAFPKELAKLYEESEMMQATEMMALPPSDKAGVKPPTAAPEAPADNGDSDLPSDEERKEKRLISVKQEGLLYKRCSLAKVNPDFVKAWIAATHKVPVGHFWMISWSKPNKDAKSEFDRLLETIEKKPETFAKYTPVKTHADAPKTEATPPTTQTEGGDRDPTPREAFEIQLSEMVEAVGIGNEKIDSELKALGYASLAEVPEGEYPGIIKHFSEVL
jgi:phage recombination protein Bet